MEVNWKNNAEEPILYHRQTILSGINIGHYRVLAGEIPEHNSEFHEISIPLAGSLTTQRQTANGKKLVRNCGKVGNICLTSAGQPISAWWEAELEHLLINFDAPFVRQVALENHFSPNFELLEKYEVDDQLIRQIGLALLAESTPETSTGRIYSDSLIQTLTLHLLKNYSTATAFQTHLNGGLSGYKLRRVEEFVNANLEADLSLAEIAEVADLSQYHFARSFRKTTGQTPQQYLMQQRIERAKELLAKDDLPIVQISLQTGFKNQSHFTTLFRKFTKLTPKLWRELKLA